MCPSGARRFQEEIGRLEWAAPQDWMCEPEVIATTHPGLVGRALERAARAIGDREVRAAQLAINEHQLRTCENFLRLRQLAPGVPWAPVLQGWRRDDYLQHVELYRGYGVDLTSADWPVVGVGSVCRRAEDHGGPLVFVKLAMLFEELRMLGIRNLHAFGFKATGLMLSGGLLSSADSLAWSSNASFASKSARDAMGGGREYAGALPGHADPGFVDPTTRRTNRHRACNNCIVYALLWRARLLWRLVNEGEPHWRELARASGIPRDQRHAFEHTHEAPLAEPPVPAELVVPNLEVASGRYVEVAGGGVGAIEEDDEPPAAMMTRQMRLWED